MSDLYTIDKLKKHFEVTAEELLPSQSGNSGKFLTTDGSDIEWASVDALPSQSGNSGKYLTTNGETASWTTVDALPDQAGNSGKYLTTDGSSASWEDIDEYNLPTASSSTLGGVKVGTNLSIDSSTGVLSATDTVTTVTVTGEGNAITNIVDSNGALTATRGSTFSLSNHTHDNVYAPLDSPTFTGTPTAPTATVGTNDTQIATTAFVNTAVSSLVSSAPDTLDTLNELAAALGNDPNFATTIASDIGSKLDSNSANYVKGLSISGTTITVTAGDNSTSTLTTQDTTYTLPEATTSTLGGVIVGDGLSVSNGTISVDDQLPSQTGNAGKFLTTDGTDASWSDILNETKISSVHYPIANATTIVLTQEQAIPSIVNKYAMSVYRDGIYLNPSIDYGYNSSTRTLTFTKAFEADEIVTVVFNYIDNDSQVTVDLGVDEYEAGSGITFTNNAVTNKVVINADDQLPTQTGNSGKYLTTNGSVASWTFLSEYTLPKASVSDLGGIKVGTNLSIDNNGVLSATDTITTATITGDGNAVTSITAIDGALTVTKGETFSLSTHTHSDATQSDSGFMSALDKTKLDGIDTGANNYSLPIAGTSTLGGVKVGNNLTINSSTGILSADNQLPSQTNNSGKFLSTDGTDASWVSISEYSLPIASSSTLGGIKVGSNLSIDSSTGVLSATDTITTATTTGDGNAVTAITATNGALTVTKGETFSLSNHTHDNVYAPLASPTFTGTPTAPTASAGTNSTQVATTAYVDNAVSSLVNSAPTTLDTLNELAAALGNDPNFATTISTEIGEKLDADSSDYVKSLSISGTTVTVTKGDDTTSTLTTQDTTYSAGDGITLTGTTFSADDQLPSQTGNAGKFLTTDGTDASWSDILNEIKISSVHYPTANATTVVLTQAQTIPSTTNKYAMSVYRNGIYLNPSIDYGYNNSTRTLTFTDAFEDDEIVTVVFSYLDTDSQVTLDIDVDVYEAGTGVTFTNNAITNKVVINADDQLPSQTNNSGKFLTTNGSTVSWETVDALPDQTDNSGKFLTTNGASASWATITQYTLPEATTSTLGGVIVGSGLSVNNGTISVNDQLPSQTSNSGKFLTTNGTSASWATVDTFPSQSGNSGKFLTTNGSAVSWATVDALPSQTGNSGKFLTTDGTDASWEDVFAGEVRVSSMHNPTENATTIVLTTAQVPANDVTKWGLSVYRDGIFLINGIDYTYASNSRTLTFTRAFSANEVVSVNFAYVSSDTETIWEVPTQTGQAGKFLLTDGTDPYWGSPFSLVREFNTTAGQNTLTLPSDFLTLNQYDAMVVFLDGIRLVKNVDYTFDSSTRVLTFVDTFISGDTVTVGLYANNYEALSSGEFPALASGILTSDGNSMSWKSFTKMVYTHDTTSANETVTIPQANLTDAVVTDVFRNGLLLVESDDYTIDSSTREITFVVPLAANEKIVVVTQNAIINSANLISGATLQNSTANTPSAGDNSTSIATTAFVNNALSGIDLSNYATTSAVTTAINNRFANPIEKVNAITSAASITIDPSAGSLFTLSLSTNASITIGNVSNGPYTTNGSTITLYLSNTSNTITWDSKITWMSGEAPDVTSNPSIITFVTFNGGTNWYGSSIEVTSSN